MKNLKNLQNNLEIFIRMIKFSGVLRKFSKNICFSQYNYNKFSQKTTQVSINPQKYVPIFYEKQMKISPNSNLLRFSEFFFEIFKKIIIKTLISAKNLRMRTTI